MRVKSLFVKFILVYLCCGLIVLTATLAITFNAGRTIRDFAINQWRLGKQEGLNKLSGSLEGAISMSRLLTANNDFTSLVYYTPPDSRDLTISLMNAYSVFSETGIIMDDFDFAFTVFKKNDILLSTDSATDDIASYYDSFMYIQKDGRRIESVNEFKDLLFSSFSGGLGYLTLERFVCTSGSRPVELKDPVLILTSSDALYGRPMYITVFVLDSRYVVDMILKPEMISGGFLRVRVGDERIISYGDYSPESSAYHTEQDYLEGTALSIETGLPLSYFYNETRHVTSFMLLYLLCGGIAALAFAVVMGNKRFGSVKRLYTEALGKEIPEKGNEYDAISDNIREIKKESHEYKEMVRILQEQNLAVRLYSFCLSGIYDEKDLTVFEKLFPGKPDCFALAVIRVLSLEPDNPDTILTLSEYIKDKGISFTHIPAGDNDELFLCGWKADEMSFTSITEAFTSLAKSSEETIHAGISLPFYDITKLDRAYSEAKQVVQSFYTRSQESLAEVYNESPGNELAECPLTVATAGKLSSLLSCGKKTEALRFIHDLGEYFHAHPFLFERMKGDFYHMLDFVFQSSEDGTEKMKSADFSRKLSQQEFIDIFIARLDRICAYQDSKKKSHNDRLCRTILSYLAENYTDPSLTAAMVSSEMGISEKYLSQFMKEQTGCSFSDYLRKVRIDKAVWYLETTDYSNEKIAELTGFGGVNTLYRNFSKQLGVTPKVYKDNFLNSKKKA